MLTSCSTFRCNEEKDTIVGTSTSCSASCGSRTGVRAQSSSMRILGTSITCTKPGCRAARRHRPTAVLPSAAQQHLLHGVPLVPLLRPDLREPVRPGAPDGRQVIHVHWMVQCACRLVRGMRPERGRVVQAGPPPARLLHLPVGAVWCAASARAIATVMRSRLAHERSRRSRRLIAAPATRAPSMAPALRFS